MTQKDEALKMAIEALQEYRESQVICSTGLGFKSKFATESIDKAINTCKAALSEPETVALPVGWVSVEDRLPESKIKVLCAVKISPNHYDIHDGEFKNGRWRDGAGFDFWGKITHWMPLPAAPTLNEKG